MSAVVAIQKERSIVVATDSRLQLRVGRDGEKEVVGTVDGVRKMIPVGEGRVLCQGSKGGTFNPEEHPDLMEDLEGLTVEKTIRRLSEWNEDPSNRSLYLYVAGVDPKGVDAESGGAVPVFGGVHGEGVQVVRQTNNIPAVGMEALINRLWRPVMYPDKAGGRISQDDFIDMPVEIDPADLSIPEAIDCAVWLIRMAGRYTEFLSGDDRERAMQQANIKLDEDGRAERTIGGPVQAAVIVRDGVRVARNLYTFGDTFSTEHEP